MTTEKWTRWPHNAGRIDLLNWIGPTNSMAQHAAFGFVFSAYMWGSSGEHAGFVGSAGLNFNPWEVSYTWGSSGEHAGFVGSAGLTFDYLEVVYTRISSGEHAGFVGSAGLNFNPFEVSYTAPVSGEHAGFVGSAGLSFDPLERNYTWGNSSEHAGFFGGADYAFTQGPDENPASYSFTSSGEFFGFTGFGEYSFVNFIEPKRVTRGQRGYITRVERPAYTPIFYLPATGARVGGLGGAAYTRFIPAPVHYSYAPLIIAGVI